MSYESRPGTGTSRKPFIRTDKFGNAFQLVKGYKNDNGFTKGYVQLGSKLYSIEFGLHYQEDTYAGKNKGKEFTFIRVTSRKPFDRQTSM